MAKLEFTLLLFYCLLWKAPCMLSAYYHNMLKNLIYYTSNLYKFYVSSFKTYMSHQITILPLISNNLFYKNNNRLKWHKQHQKSIRHPNCLSNIYSKSRNNIFIHERKRTFNRQTHFISRHHHILPSTLQPTSVF